MFCKISEHYDSKYITILIFHIRLTLHCNTHFKLKIEKH